MELNRGWLLNHNLFPPFFLSFYFFFCLYKRQHLSLSLSLSNSIQSEHIPFNLTTAATLQISLFYIHYNFATMLPRQLLVALLAPLGVSAVPTNDAVLFSNLMPRQDGKACDGGSAKICCQSVQACMDAVSICQRKRSACRDDKKPC